MSPFPEDSGTAIPVASTLVEVTTQSWSLLGKSFGPERETALRLTLMSDGSCQIARTDGKPLGDLAELYKARIETARTDLQLHYLRERNAETKRTTRRLAAAGAAAQVEAPVPDPAAGEAPALERKRKPADLSSTRFVRYDPKTINDRINRMHEDQELAKANPPAPEQEAQPTKQEGTSAWDDKGAEK